MNLLFRKLLNNPGLEAEISLRQADKAVQYVPVDAKYVSMAQLSETNFDSLSTFVMNTSNPGPGPRIVHRNQKILGDGVPGYLFHDGTTLSFVTTETQRFAIPLSAIKATKRVPLYSGYWGLAISYNDNGYLLTKFMPIKNDDTYKFNTPHGVLSDQVYGWLDQLRENGVTV